jgi:hypothetical protein
MVDAEEMIETFARRPDLHFLISAATEMAKVETGTKLETLQHLLPILNAAAERAGLLLCSGATPNGCPSVRG